MSSHPSVLFLDANVLFSACCRDLLIESSLVGQCHCRWTAEVLEEVRVALMRARPDLKPRQVGRLFDLLANACPEAQAKTRHVDALTLPALRDPADLHVLYGALETGSDVILTFNLRHFPPRVLRRVGLMAMTPDQWLCARAKAVPAAMIEVADRCRNRLIRPSLSKVDHLKALRRSGLTQFADFLASRVG